MSADLEAPQEVVDSGEVDELREGAAWEVAGVAVFRRSDDHILWHAEREGQVAVMQCVLEGDVGHAELGGGARDEHFGNDFLDHMGVVDVGRLRAWARGVGAIRVWVYVVQECACFVNHPIGCLELAACSPHCVRGQRAHIHHGIRVREPRHVAE